MQYGLGTFLLSGTQYVSVGQALSVTGGGTATLRFKFFTVSTTGASIALVATTDYTSLAHTSWGGAFKKIATDYYMLTYVYHSGYDLALTFRVVAGGTATLVDGPLTLGYMGQPTASLSINMCKISPTVWAACFEDNTSGLVRKLVTFECDAVGNLGSIIDTDTAVVTANGNRMIQMDYLVSTFILLTHVDGSGGKVQTIAVSTDGTIGAQISASGVATYPWYTYYMGVGDSYLCFSMAASFYANSLTVVLPDPVIETLGVSELKYNQATLWANITEVGAAEEYGFDWSIGAGNFENELLSSDPIIPGLFNILLTGLSYNTAYKYRAKIGLGGVWSYGATGYFTTVFPVPEVETDLPAAATSTYIDAVGHVMDDGGVAPIDKYGFVYGCTSVEEMLGRFNNELSKAYSPDDAKEDGFDANEQVTGTLAYTVTGATAASGQKNVTLGNPTGFVAGMKIVLANSTVEEVLEIDTIVGSVATMLTNLVNTYAAGASVGQQVTIRLRNLEYGKRYYIRFWAHNQYGYAWGGEMCALTSDTVNVLIPTATASKGIRFCVPGKVNFPPTGMWYDTRHHLLVKSPDSYFVNEGAFGWVIGKYVCERQYWAEATNIDLYTMSDAVKRTGTIIKVKYKARIGNNAYGIGQYHKRVVNNGSTSLTGSYVSSSAVLGWFCEIWYDNPWTSAPWTVEETDALQMGISIRSGTGWEIPLCDCIEGRVIWANAAVSMKWPKVTSATGIKLHALVTEDECEECTVVFEWGLTTGYGNTTTPAQAAVKGQHVYADITVTPGLTYHARAAITTACGETFYSADWEFNGPVLELAFGQSIFTTTPTWTDVSTDLLDLYVKRGRNHDLDRCEAGTAVFILKNTHGNWWRNNTAGAYYPSVKPLTLIRLRWDFEGMYPVYYGVTEAFTPGWLEERGGLTAVMNIGAVDFLKSFAKYRIVDANPALTEDATTGQSHAHVDNTYGLVEGQTITLYDTAGTEDLIIQQVVPALNTVIFTTTVVGNYHTGATAKLKKWPAVMSGVRLHDIILECGFPLALCTLDTGTVKVIAISPAASGANALDEMNKVVEAEDGNLFVSVTGYLIFHDALARTETPLVTSQGTFLDTGAANQFALPEFADDEEYTYNQASIAGDGITEQLMIDSVAQAEQGPRAIQRTSSYIFNEYDAIRQALILVLRYKESNLRCKALNIPPDASPEDLYPLVLGLDLGNRITLQVNNTNNPAMLNEKYHIEGVTHKWNPRKGWRTAWQLWGANRYRGFLTYKDGFVEKLSDVSYTDCHNAAAGSNVFNNDALGLQVGQWAIWAGGIFTSQRIQRGVVEFDTSTILTSDTVAEGFILVKLADFSNTVAWKIDILGANGAYCPLALSDYSILHDATDLAADELDVVAPPGWHVFSLNALGLAQITKEGITHFAVRSNRDVAATDPGALSSEWATLAGKGYLAAKYQMQLILRLG
jgi:hypothetical protein